MTHEKLSVPALTAARAAWQSRSHRLAQNQPDSHRIGDFNHRSAANSLFDWFDKQIGLAWIEKLEDAACY